MRPKLRTLSSVAIFAVATFVVVGLSVVISGQGTRQPGMGLPDDWSHHHLVFSDPGTAAEALGKGHFAEWYRTVTDSRFTIQRMKRNPAANRPVSSGLASEARALLPDISDLASVYGNHLGRNAKLASVNKDWSVPLGTYAANIAGGQYPAKFGFSVTDTPTCSDYVVYPTGVAGSGSQATVIAYNNLYSGTCSSGSVPTTYWAFNTGATATLSPALSVDGTQVAFVQTSSSQASLVLLKMAAGGSVSSPGAITSVIQSSYRGCTAPCYTSMTFRTTGTIPNDTNSQPFVDYGNDFIYVGENNGYLHKFTGVFKGTPAESSANGWPVQVSTQTAHNLTGPVYDSGSQFVFLGDSTGYMYKVTTTGSTSQTVTRSGQMDNGGPAGIVDAPLVDTAGATTNVYAFIQNNTTPALYINQLPTTFTGGAFGSALQISLGTGITTNNMLYSGTFDNSHTTSTNGNLYWCAVDTATGALPTLYRIAMASTFSSSTFTSHAVATGAGTCSSITEIYNSNTTHDWLFLSVTASGNDTGCTGACLYNYNVTSGLPASAAAGLAVTGGASGVIVDNISTASGAAQIYYNSLGNSGSCGTNQGCAVQASQAAP